ncbi:UPF0262 family protein [Sphingomonas nostoxanthinifaciens]|uniref:UPF0262 family protein n=1 Tax=Sphingomonas nostoxanthinifaciens TaxID=2872652 RepID=UPI001CC2168D|nr:UPF0262 family protein [Sphingomonas nostoxanthinifaciens]UAK23896.1 UPF0262 family protein [Sphingomonas nostoxanthinifaciens]
MPEHRIIAIDLDQATILARTPEIEQERAVAIRDLLTSNSFAPRRPIANGYGGPYRLGLRVEEGRLAIGIAERDGRLLETIILGLARFRRVIRDYFAICDSYFQAVAQAQPAQIEAIDMARRGIHNGAAELLVTCLEGKVALDFDTARRLFTLITALHIRG